ncbi:RNA polymerase sigma factor [Parapedobacter indicus]|uniref:RNA polymerase sigma-70 factor, ECF subfamily n=1 Tax=Parapedobacter indicus TaxID=1477437 RepID=A0A1I3N8B8_9SPHI|nr:sigma-70 family RNA polymerase sigma factor [Parapedobacter indicus]PPL00910.1 RNA polymerase sigma-70 factor (ECF subfamily) [Parapedobacter indicus]SFJ05472.1 RNA polymerase sigma-70 factor, ECF subfamily [Parapedobacter indicus]
MFNEQHLLAEYRKTGDLQLLGKLYEPYMPLIYGLCLKYYKDEAKSEDAVMQIFESLISKLRVHEVNNFKSWLYTLARNHCLMELRKANRVTTVDIEEHVVESDVFLHQQDEGEQIPEERLVLMESCLETLSDEQRRCITLFYMEQKCYKDVAEQTGYDLGQVKSYIQNGKRNLKICMEKSRDEQ